jgi:hypothetical protein
MMNSYQDVEICELVHLGHELDDITSKLDSLAAQLNHGVVDDELYEETRSQVSKCIEWLDTAFQFRTD